ncbi:N-acetylmuramoyl-L-alanine amidase [Lacticaseibacillus suibinensis]|uniref:N-acetylmuramoyl-L-alanine amidase n=1 Tax=Lacticaseibacillus suibinensis TaxID=2486011 RepID=UPI000F7879A8|nr:N-acetylmuramoyl-L-alanine amidase [Lacticaseibacillus suibinensis]
MVTINKSLAINAGTAAAIGKIIVLHSTDDMEATAKQMATYEHRVWRSAQTFVHFGVDDQGAYQVGTPGRVAWGAGNVNRYAPVQIELCEFSDKTRAMKAYHNWIALAAAMAKQYGVPRTLDDGNRTAGFKSHLWCSRNYGGSDHGDPYPYLTKLGISKAQLAKDLGAATGSVTTSAAAPATSTASAGVDGYWGTATTTKLQRLYGTTVDGVVSSQYNWHNAGLTGGWQFVGKPVGSLLIAAIQRALGVKADGILGPDTIKAMQRKAGTPVDGKISAQSQLVMYMQKCANAGKRPF